VPTASQQLAGVSLGVYVMRLMGGVADQVCSSLMGGE